jgi:hypothetical protein
MLGFQDYISANIDFWPARLVCPIPQTGLAAVLFKFRAWNHDQDFVHAVLPDCQRYWRCMSNASHHYGCFFDAGIHATAACQQSLQSLSWYTASLPHYLLDFTSVRLKHTAVDCAGENAKGQRFRMCRLLD